MSRRWIVRLVVFGLVAGAVWRFRQSPATPSVAPAAPTPSWVEPVDGACPPGFPVKLNLQSGIFHVPGGRSYDRSVPARCYASADAAEADGYRRAKA